MKRLLIYTPYSLWPNDTTILAYLAGILSRRGWAVELLTCGGALRICDIRQPSRGPQYARVEKDVVCHHCRQARGLYNRLAECTIHTLDHYRSPDCAEPVGWLILEELVKLAQQQGKRKAGSSGKVQMAASLVEKLRRQVRSQAPEQERQALLDKFHAWLRKQVEHARDKPDAFIGYALEHWALLREAHLTGVAWESGLSIIDQIEQAPSFAALQNVRFKGYDLLDIVESSINVHLRLNHVDYHQPAQFALLKPYLIDAVQSLDAAERFLQQHQFDRIIVRNGRMNTTRAMVEVLKRLGLDYTCMDRGSRQGTLMLIRNDINLNFYRICEQVLDQVGQQPLPPEALSKVAKCLFPETHIVCQYDWEATQQTRQALRLDRDYVVMLTSSTDEANSLCRQTSMNRTFDDQHEYLRMACEQFHQQREDILVIRAHPNSGSKKSLGVNREECEFIAQLKKQYAHSDFVRIVEPQDEVNSYSLALGSKAALVWVTSMSFDLACFGIPVIEAGGWHVGNLPFIYHLRDKDIVGAVRKACDTHRTQWRDQAILAMRYYAIRKFRALFDINGIDWRVWHTLKLTDMSLDEIEAHYGYEIDRLVAYLNDELPDFALDYRQLPVEVPVQWQSEDELLDYLRERYLPAQAVDDDDNAASA